MLFGMKLRNIALAGDVILFAVFTLMGVANHGESVGFLNFFRNFISFTVAWLVVGSLSSAFALSTIRSFRRTYQRVPIALVISGMVGVLIRDFVFVHHFSLSFALVAIAFTTLIVTAWRLVLASVPGR